jgi:hypothetical protein
MASYLVNVELEYPSQTRFDILDELKKFATPVELTETCYAIDTTEKAETVYRRLKSLLHENDLLYVLTLAPGWFGRGPSDANAWLNKHVGD